MISVNNVTMRYGARLLFDDVTCTFMAGRRYAITGPNGAGKSTLMKILTGELEPTKGNIARPKKLGVLRQDQFAFDDFRVIDTVIMGNASLWETLQERETLYAKPHDELTDADGMRLGELEGIVGEEGGYTAESAAAGWTYLPNCTIGKWASSKVGKKSVCCWRRRCLAIPPRCCWTSRPTTWISIRCTGCRIIFARTRAC
jgi:ATPase subunit of ABC transporter with duplicated ATPase domains